jgi:hypothetical protein
VGKKDDVIQGDNAPKKGSQTGRALRVGDREIKVSHGVRNSLIMVIIMLA